MLTDIGGDPDDQQSLIRLMTYANEFSIEGLIATASGRTGELRKGEVKPHLIRAIVNAYGEVRDNLVLHDENYPSLESLLRGIKSGNPERGRHAIGEGHDTEGSRWIVSTVDRADLRPVHISIWGGQTDLAQALWRVRQDRGLAALRRFQASIRIYDIGDQDRLADWIIGEFPGLFYVLPKPEAGEDRREAVYRGMYLGGDESLTSRAWIDEHVRVAHGALGALYPTRTWTAPNPHSTMKEGDTPSWFFFLSNGLNAPNHPDWGGWGGRFQSQNQSCWRDAVDTIGPDSHRRVTVWRWRPAFQADFAARMDWCVKERLEANHPPHAVVDGIEGKSIVSLDLPGAGSVFLDAGGSFDPDGDNLKFQWWHYAEAGHASISPEIRSSSQPHTEIVWPEEAPPGEYHIILEVMDDGEPALTSYRRIVIKTSNQASTQP